MKENLNIIRLPELCKKIGMSKPSVYRMMKEGNFPKSIQITGVRSVGWIESDIDRWIEARIQA